MKTRKLVLAGFLCFICLGVLSGCLGTPGYSGNGGVASEPAVIAHLDIRKKKIFIESVWKTLKTFERSATDAARRKKPGLDKTLAREMDVYFRNYVNPILDDTEAVGHLETKLDVAKVHLLSGLVFAHLGEPSPARRLLKRFDERYGSDPSFLSSTLDYETTGFGSLSEGRDALGRRVINNY